jgi:hypothetical protein
VKADENYTVAQEGYIHDSCLQEKKTLFNPALIKKTGAAAAVLVAALGLALAGGLEEPTTDTQKMTVSNGDYNIQIEYEVSEPVENRDAEPVSARHIVITSTQRT